VEGRRKEKVNQLCRADNTMPGLQNTVFYVSAAIWLLLIGARVEKKQVFVRGAIFMQDFLPVVVGLAVGITFIVALVIMIDAYSTKHARDDFTFQGSAIALWKQ
jgi:hypothetical protein